MDSKYNAILRLKVLALKAICVSDFSKQPSLLKSTISYYVPDDLELKHIFTNQSISVSKYINVRRTLASRGDDISCTDVEQYMKRCPKTKEKLEPI